MGMSQKHPTLVDSFNSNNRYTLGATFAAIWHAISNDRGSERRDFSDSLALGCVTHMVRGGLEWR